MAQGIPSNVIDYHLQEYSLSSGFVGECNISKRLCDGLEYESFNSMYQKLNLCCHFLVLMKLSMVDLKSIG